MKEFFSTVAGVLLGSLLFVLILGSPGDSSVSLKSETGNVMKATVQQMHKIAP
jgi:hypothetical protein